MSGSRVIHLAAIERAHDDERSAQATARNHLIDDDLRETETEKRTKRP